VNILSIQSWVAYGHVGNASAVFPLQRLGAEVWAVNTVQFSNHPGYGGFTGHVCTPAQIDALIEGIAARGVLPGCDAVLSGYMGDPGTGDAIIRAVERVKAANPAALYCCDPVIGDDGGGVYVRAGIPELIRDRALRLADIVTPNQFELSHLTGIDASTLAGAIDAVRRLQALGPATVLVTSLRTEDTPADSIDLLAAEGGAFHLLRTPRLAFPGNGAINGAGDAIAGLFLLHRLRSGGVVTALERAAASVFGILRRTAEAGSREMLTIAAQDELIRPTTLFPSRRLP
jgi:pyridoxine kinase